jgi:hypothetical protein
MSAFYVFATIRYYIPVAAPLDNRGAFDDEQGVEKSPIPRRREVLPWMMF